MTSMLQNVISSDERLSTVTALLLFNRPSCGITSLMLKIAQM